MAKLDPDNYKSAKDVLDEQQAAQRKRKREEEGDLSGQEETKMEQPFDGISRKKKRIQKQKTEEKEDASIPTQDAQPKPVIAKESSSGESSRRKAKLERKKQRKETKKEKAKQKAAKLEATRERKAEQSSLQEVIEEKAIGQNHEEKSVDGDVDLKLESVGVEAETSRVEDHSLSTATPSPTDRSPETGGSAIHSASSSISSIPPSMSSEPQALQKPIEKAPPPAAAPVQKADPAELRSRLQSRIEALRASRKAEGSDGLPAQSRQELLEARRQKADARKAHKKELRRKAKEEETRKRAETIARGSPLLSPGSPMSQAAQPTKSNLSFGRVQFGDGQRASADLNTILESKGKTRGPSDPATALTAAQNKQSRLAALDASKQADIAEKDSWLNARKRAQGERIRDDTSLLKKTLKRKQKQKKKSERNWGDRAEGVKRAQEHRQRKREVNLAKRKEEKGGKEKKRNSKEKPQARPGFEGSFRAKAP